MKEVLGKFKTDTHARRKIAYAGVTLVMAVLVLIFSVSLGDKSELPDALNDILSPSGTVSDIYNENNKPLPDTQPEEAITESSAPNNAQNSISDVKENNKLDKSASYTSKNDVAEYLTQYNKLPSNYITKNEAKKLGWVAKEGNLWEVTDHMSIGGDRFGNNEGLLPKEKNRKYFECDIDYNGGTRNAKRIVFSNDGLIFYTEDHYNSFEQYDKETSLWK